MSQQEKWYIKMLEFGWGDEPADCSEELSWPNSTIFAQWKVEWTANNGPSDEPFFDKWFPALYSKVKNEADRYFTLNFFKKRQLIRCLRLCFLFQFLGTVGYCLWCKLTPLHIRADILLALETAFILSGILFVLPYGKWIDVKKYQETWARHRTQQEKIELEMLKYISGSTPYDNLPHKNQAFVNAILKTEKVSIHTFQQLLQQQEKGMLNEFPSMK